MFWFWMQTVFLSFLFIRCLNNQSPCIGNRGVLLVCAVDLYLYEHSPKGTRYGNVGAWPRACTRTALCQLNHYSFCHVVADRRPHPAGGGSPTHVPIPPNRHRGGATVHLGQRVSRHLGRAAERESGCGGRGARGGLRVPRGVHARGYRWGFFPTIPVEWRRGLFLVGVLLRRRPVPHTSGRSDFQIQRLHVRVQSARPRPRGLLGWVSARVPQRGGGPRVRGHVHLPEQVLSWT